MSWFVFWKYLHILILVFWLGTDLGVMLLAKKSKQTNLAFESRLLSLQMAMVIDTVPRIMSALALPVGMLLARHIGLVEIGNPGMTLIWLFSFAWIGINLGATANHEKPIGLILQKVHWVLLAVLGTALLLVAATSYVGGGPFWAPWLALKVGFYGLICWLAIGIDWAFRPVGPAFAQLAGEGSTPAIERELSRGIDNAVRFVYCVYLCLLVIAYLGVAKTP